MVTLEILDPSPSRTPSEENPFERRSLRGEFHAVRRIACDIAAHARTVVYVRFNPRIHDFFCTGRPPSDPTEVHAVVLPDNEPKVLRASDYRITRCAETRRVG